MNTNMLHYFILAMVFLTIQRADTVKLVPRYIYDKVEHSKIYHETVAVYEHNGAGSKLGLVRFKRDPNFHSKAQGKIRLVASDAHLQD